MFKKENWPRISVTFKGEADPAGGEWPKLARGSGGGVAGEWLFSFVLRARIFLVGRDILPRSKSKLHFVLISDDL